MPTENKEKYATIINEFKTANPRYMVVENRSEFLLRFPDLFPKEVRDADAVLKGPQTFGQKANLLNKFVGWLDEDFTLVGDNNQPLITNINLIPLFDEFIKTNGGKFPSAKIKDVEELASDIRNAMLDSYALTEQTTMQSMGFDEAKSMSEEERFEAAKQRVLADEVYSANYRAVVTKPGSISPVTGQPVGPGEFNASARLEDDIDEFDEYLRLIPDSSVYDLADFEKGFANDDEFSEGFDSSMFAGWLSSKAKDEVTAKKEDGTTAKWSAAQAIKFIYDLSDQNMTGKITELQKMLREAGYFAVLGPTPEQAPLPIPGVVDKNMEQAWGLFLTDAARMNKTPADMFKEKTRQMRRIVETGEGITGRDQASISSDIDALAYNLLGRRLSPAEKQSLYTAVRGWEREQLSSQLYAPQPTQIDVTARLEQLIQTQNQNEMAFNSIDSMNKKFDSWFGA